VKPRADKGEGPADPRKAGPTTAKPGPASGTPLRPGDLPGGPIRNAADLVAAVRGVRGDAFGPVVGKGWDFLAGTPAEAKALKELASKEKDHRIRAALVLCLGADGGEEARAATKEFLADESPDVRAAAALALARSLSYESPAKKPVASGPPLGTQVLLGVLAEDPRRAELAGRLAVEGDPGVRRTLLQVLGPSAGADPVIRDRLLDGVRGLYGDEQRETALKAVQGLQDPAIVDPLFEILVNPATPKALQAGLFDGMVKADARAASEKFGEVLKSESPELRRLVVAACPNAGTPAAQKALVDALGSDQDAGVRVAVVLALQRFPAKEVLEAVHRAADNDTDLAVRQEAERVHKILKATLEKAEGPQENPPADNPPAPAPAPAPAGDGN
jgi:hypothetical protein